MGEIGEAAVVEVDVTGGVDAGAGGGAAAVLIGGEVLVGVITQTDLDVLGIVVGNDYGFAIGSYVCQNTKYPLRLAAKSATIKDRQAKVE